MLSVGVGQGCVVPKVQLAKLKVQLGKQESRVHVMRSWLVYVKPEGLCT